MTLISALEISLVGTAVVFCVLLILAALIQVIGYFMRQISSPSSTVLKANLKESSTESDEQQVKRDIAIITAVMHQLGHEGQLKIKLIK